jgi:hypothetical protein
VTRETYFIRERGLETPPTRTSGKVGINVRTLGWFGVVAIAIDMEF